jgi:hypothetical protein
MQFLPHRKHTNTLCWQQTEFLMLKLVVHTVTSRAGSRVFGALCEIIVAPPLAYIVYWYICLTLNRVKVHK